jgi:hypothetical protein
MFAAIQPYLVKYLQAKVYACVWTFDVLRWSAFVCIPVYMQGVSKRMQHVEEFGIKVALNENYVGAQIWLSAICYLGLCSGILLDEAVTPFNCIQMVLSSNLGHDTNKIKFVWL